ncbi:MAG: flagellar hook-basal body complex protein FliE [Bdellovibrionota bacterium]
MSTLSIENLGRIIEVGGEPALKTVRNIGLQDSSPNTFSDILKNSLEKVNQHQNEADTAIKELMAGRTKNVHETMLLLERADASLKMMMQVRNKILDAYREVMKMQV